MAAAAQIKGQFGSSFWRCFWTCYGRALPRETGEERGEGENRHVANASTRNHDEIGKNKMDGEPVKPVLIAQPWQESSRRPRGAADTSKIKNLPVLSNRLSFRRSGRTICMAGAAAYGRTHWSWGFGSSLEKEPCRSCP